MAAKNAKRRKEGKVWRAGGAELVSSLRVSNLCGVLSGAPVPIQAFHRTPQRWEERRGGIDLAGHGGLYLERRSCLAQTGGWNGQPARSARQLAARMEGVARALCRVVGGVWRAPRSAGLVARRHRLVACATLSDFGVRFHGFEQRRQHFPRVLLLRLLAFFAAIGGRCQWRVWGWPWLWWKWWMIWWVTSRRPRYSVFTRTSAWR